MTADIQTWHVTVDGRRSAFDDLDTALAYLRGYIGTNGGNHATLESRRMDPLHYAAEVELEDGGGRDGLS